MTLQNSSYDWKYYTEPCSTGGLGLKNHQSFWPRGKMLGGCSGINAMLYVRGNRRDFDEHWQKAGGADWNWDSILPYFKKSENNRFQHANKDHHGTDGSLNIGHFPATNYDDYIKFMLQQMFTESGFNLINDINGDSFIGFGRSFGNLFKGARQSSAKAYLSPSSIGHRDNLHIIKMAHVNKLHIDKKTKQVTGVEFVRLPEQKTFEAKVKKEVVLSAGAINTPQILMLSGIGPADDLTANQIEIVHSLWGIGKNLQDHIMVPLIFSLHKSTAKVPTLQFLAENFLSYVQQRSGLFSNLGSVDYMGFFSTVNDTLYPDIQVLNYLIPKANTDTMNLLLGLFNYNDDIVKSIVAANMDADVLFMYVILLNPSSSGVLTLRSKNPQDKPKIDSRYLHDAKDVKTFIRATNLLNEVIKTKTFKEHEGETVRIDLKKCNQFSKKENDYWECYVRHMAITLYHPVGSAKMGPVHDEDGVVVAQLKVHGINVLRVADASIMPKIVSGNTNAAAVVIGEKAADFIKQTWTNSEGFCFKDGCE